MTQIYLSIYRKTLHFQKKKYYIPQNFVLEQNDETNVFTLETDLTKLNTISFGGFSIIIIYKAMYEDKKIAVKIYCSKKNDINKAIKNEIHFYNSIDYQNDDNSKFICLCFGTLEEKYKEYNYSYIFLEKMKIDLYDYLKNDKQDSLNLMNNYNNIIKSLQDIHNGLQFVHNKNYVYNDLKLENIMISQDNKIKLIDFNCVYPIELTYTKKINLKKHFVGTVDFLAPELFVVFKKNDSKDDIFYNYNQIDFKSDIWSFGIVLYEFLLKKNFPYVTNRKTQTIQNIKQNILNDTEYSTQFFKNKLSLLNLQLNEKEINNLCNLFSNCFKTNPEKRNINFDDMLLSK